MSGLSWKHKYPFHEALPLDVIQELDLHLQKTPFIPLSLSFDHQKILAEALGVLSEFVDHRYGDETPGGPRWKSLCLHGLEGDPYKTRNHTEYGVLKNPRYALTSIAERCPETTAFMHRFAIVEKCKRIRFMLLEPGAKIAVHNDPEDDNPQYPVSIACNVAINMPLGCRFWMNCDSQGRHHAGTQEVPFVDGSAMLLNVARYHYVVNDSTIPRIHMIFHGPLRISYEEVLRAARRVNGVLAEGSQNPLTGQFL